MAWHVPYNLHRVRIHGTTSKGESCWELELRGGLSLPHWNLGLEISSRIWETGDTWWKVALCQLTTLWGPPCYPPLTIQEMRLMEIISPGPHPRPLGASVSSSMKWEGWTEVLLGTHTSCAWDSWTLREVAEVASPNLITKHWRAGRRYPLKRIPRRLCGWWGQWQKLTRQRRSKFRENLLSSGLNAWTWKCWQDMQVQVHSREITVTHLFRPPLLSSSLGTLYILSFPPSPPPSCPLSFLLFILSPTELKHAEAFLNWKAIKIRDYY